jgi:REP element-mobilizing transposase RayT
MKIYHQKLIPGNTYHIYNRAIANEKLFLNENNYRYFLQKFSKYIVPIAETVCYCLMPNHFHFLVRIRDEKELFPFINKAVKQSRTLENVLSQEFSNLFNTYVQAFNKLHNRKGSLFMKNYNRLMITDEVYVRKLILYIHNNPVDSGIVDNLNDWKYSSYRLLSKGYKDSNCSHTAIDYFEDLENFKYCHLNPSSA